MGCFWSALLTWANGVEAFLTSLIALGLSVPVCAQPKADAGSGPTSGAVSTNDAGSGPTQGAKPNTGADRGQQFQRSYRKQHFGKQRRRYPGAQVNRRLAAGHAGNAREEAVISSTDSYRQRAAADGELFSRQGWAKIIERPSKAANGAPFCDKVIRSVARAIEEQRRTSRRSF